MKWGVKKRKERHREIRRSGMVGKRETGKYNGVEWEERVEMEDK